MISPPMIAPITRADAAGDRCATDEDRGDRVQFERRSRPWKGGVAPGGEGDSGDRGQDAHVDEQPEVDPLGVDTGQLGGKQIAAAGVDVPAEDELVHHRAVDKINAARMTRTIGVPR